MLYSSLRYYECSMYVFCFSIYPNLFLDDTTDHLYRYKKNHIFDSIPQFYTYVSIILNSLKIAMNFVKKYIDLQMMWAPRRHDSAAILVIYTKMRTTMCKRCRQPLLCTKLFRSLWRSKCTRFAVIQYKPHVAFYPRFSSLHDKT